MDEKSPDFPGGGDPLLKSDDVLEVDPGLEGKPPGVVETSDQLISRLRKNPVMTEIGKANLIKTLKSQINSILKRLNRQLDILSPLLDSKDFAKVSSETSILDRIHSELTNTHARFCKF